MTDTVSEEQQTTEKTSQSLPEMASQKLAAQVDEGKADSAWAEETESDASRVAGQGTEEEGEATQKLVTMTEQLKLDATAGINLKDKKYGEIDWSGEIMVQQNDPNSPIYAKCQDFRELGLPADLLKGLYAMNFNKPSKVQETTLPMILADPPRDLIAQSQSGTGKTAAFSLGMLSRVDPSSKYPQAICLGPTRELVKQTFEVVSTMAKFTEIKCRVAIAEERLPRGYQIEDQVLVGTPGSILNWAKYRFFDPRQIRIMVFDEADDMMDRVKRDDSVRMIRMLSSKHQTLLFSATYPDQVRKFCEEQLPRANMVILKQQELTLDGIAQYCVDCQDSDHRYDVLNDIYGAVSIGQVIIFCERVDTARKLNERLVAEGHSVAALYGGKEGERMSVQERDATMKSFREGKAKVLITTNVLARGIDISQVNVVVNYDIPVKFGEDRPDYETYLHRIGRTGRFGRRGAGINFVYDGRTRQYMEDIERYFGRPIKHIPTDDPELFEQMFQIS